MQEHMRSRSYLRGWPRAGLAAASLSAMLACSPAVSERSRASESVNAEVGSRPHASPPATASSFTVFESG